MTKATWGRLLLGVVLAACGGGVAPIDADGGAGSSGGSGGGSGTGTSASSSSSSSSSSGGTSGGASGASGGTSGGTSGGSTSGGSTSGGPPPPPPTLTCGSASCDTATQDCCDSRASGTLMCVTKGTCMGASLTCTSAADCPMGQICCLTGGGPGGPPQSSCDTRCGRDGPGGGQQLCATDAECGMRHCFKDSAGLGICAPF